MTETPLVEMSRSELLAAVQSAMTPKRFRHVLGVEETARELARRYGVDEEKAALAGLLHDYAKEASPQVFSDLIDKYQLDPDLKNWGSSICHGLVGIYKIQEDFGVNDSEILNAIAVHTVGAARMSQLAKVLYVADYIEPNRDFQGVEKARDIARKSLDAAVAYETVETVAHLVKKAQPIYPQTIETYNAFVGYYPKQD